jgi:adenylate cyclase
MGHTSVRREKEASEIPVITEPERLLELAGLEPARLPEVERQIRERYEEIRAVMVVDMCGLSQTTHERGAVHALALVHHLRSIARPAIVAHDGVVVEMTADDILCLFDSVPCALAAAQEISAAAEARNAGAVAAWQVDISIGIGYGPLLNFDCRRIAGDELNLASKLGEDVAGPREVILTESAWTTLCASAGEWRQSVVSFGAQPVKCFRAPIAAAPFEDSTFG